jgi:hypothetical protein
MEEDVMQLPKVFSSNGESLDLETNNRSKKFIS